MKSLVMMTLSTTVWMDASLDALPGVGAMTPRMEATGCILLNDSQVAPGVVVQQVVLLVDAAVLNKVAGQYVYGDRRVTQRFFVAT